VDECQSSEILSTQLIDDSPVYHALSVHLCQTKSIICFRNRYTEAKFLKSGVREKVLEGNTVISADTRISH